MPPTQPTPPPAARPLTTPPGLAEAYRAPSDGLDTMRDGRGALRDDWRAMAARLDATDGATLEHRRAQGQGVLDDNGILLAGPASAHRLHLWPLDPVPFQLGEAAFSSLAAAMAQRATLLNRLAGDLLGEQRVLKEKVLPPALLFANPHYRRAYHGLPVRGGRYLHVYSADLVRAQDGQWWVQGDRTQAPSGLGFTLEHRIALSRVHADWLGEVPVQRHAPFFVTLRETLAGLAPRDRGNPHVVLLSEGLKGHRGFEDAFLARYLGYTLTVGQDLAVRRGETVLKTLGGARPVEVVFRRVDDDACDPVELDGASASGVAGLVESQRREQVSIANMLGTQLVEAPGLMAFLQPLCRFYFGEDLKLPSVATWWCGQAGERDYVLEHLDELYVYRAFDAGGDPIDARRLSATERDALVRRVRATPEAYVGQERVQRGTTPAWSGTGLEPWRWSLRGFAAMCGDGYRVLPGGLVRVAPRPETLDYAPSADERTQDCWVHASGAVDRTTLLPPVDGPIALTRSGAELPSRVAENLYWLGRSIEQAEGRARLLRGLVTRLDLDVGVDAGLDDAGLDAELAAAPVPDSATAGATPAGDAVWSRLLALVEPKQEADPVGEQVAATNSVRGRDRASALWSRAWGAALDPPGGMNLRQAVSECVRLAQAVRDRLSVDAWRLVSRTDRDLTRAGEAGTGAADGADLEGLLHHVVLELVAFGGLMSESMTRTLGWRFLDLGRRIERAIQTAELIRVVAGTPGTDEREALEAALEVCDSGMTYRSRYLADLRLVPALDLLLSDEINPRSVAYQLVRIEQHVNALPRGADTDVARDPEHDAALALLDAVRAAEPGALVQGPADAPRRPLVDLLERVATELPKIDAALAARYLVHAEPPRAFDAIGPLTDAGGSGGGAR